MNDKNQYPPSVQRALLIIDYLGASEQPKSIREICDSLTIPIATAYRIINCLIDYGFVSEDQSSPGKYRLSFKFSFLGKNTFESKVLIAIAHPFMEKLALETSQACQLSVLSKGSVMTIDQVLPMSVITIVAKFGEPIPINSSASGKILTSLLPEKERNTVLNKVWKNINKKTPYTIDNLQKFVFALNEAREVGYGTDYQEYAIGIGCLAVPIYDKFNNPIAALGLTGHIDNYIDMNIFNSALEKLKHTSILISEEIY